MEKGTMIKGLMPCLLELSISDVVNPVLIKSGCARKRGQGCRQVGA
jgi:hypothetical protein